MQLKIRRPRLAEGGGFQLYAVDDPKDVIEALAGRKIYLDVRGRVEVAEMDRKDLSQAWTLRARLGCGSLPYDGFSLYAEMEDIRSIVDGLYNAAGTNGQAGKTVIADPLDTELNQAYFKYSHEIIDVILGRQRIILDDARFVGNVGWRQNEQTFDAAAVILKPKENLKFQYSYVGQVKRIFGPDAGMDFDSESHLINVTLGDVGKGIGAITGFAYLLNIENVPTAASNTFGARLTGKHAFTDTFSVLYTSSLAYQADAYSNPADYEALSSDDGATGFATPLATLHKFNGFADAFLATPAAGLQDIYVYAGGSLPMGVKGKVIYHHFEADKGA